MPSWFVCSDKTNHCATWCRFVDALACNSWCVLKPFAMVCTLLHAIANCSLQDTITDNNKKDIARSISGDSVLPNSLLEDTSCLIAFVLRLEALLLQHLLALVSHRFVLTTVGIVQKYFKIWSALAYRPGQNPVAKAILTSYPYIPVAPGLPSSGQPCDQLPRRLP